MNKILCGLVLVFLCCQKSFASDWDDQALLAYLNECRRSEVLLVKRLDLVQNGHILPWYAQTGVEERPGHLRPRPVLQPADPLGPFVRGLRLVALIDRQANFELLLDLERVRMPSSAPGQLERLAPAELLLQYHPRENNEILHSVNGQYHLQLVREKYYGGLQLRCLDGSEPQDLELIFWNQNKPVVLQPANAK